MRPVVDEVRGFYDDLAAHYHLLFDDWDAAIEHQAKVLDAIILRRTAGPKRILDAACGIGTQAIGLARRGHAVTGTDLSPAAIDRARREAVRFKVEISFATADLRTLSQAIQGSFDVVCALDNALPHLCGDAELEQALHGIAGVLTPGGLLLAGIRDYDALRVERPRTIGPRLLEDKHGRRIVFQVWDWAGDGSSYVVHQYIVHHTPPDKPRTLVFKGRYWPIAQARLVRLVKDAGFSDTAWLAPQETGFFQPILAARL